MEREQFDRLIRLIGTAGSRRAALRLVATGAILGAVGTRDGSAAKRRRNNRNNRNSRTRGSVQAESIIACDHLGRDCTGLPIGPGKNLSFCDYILKFFVSFNASGANVHGALFNTATFGGRPANFRAANASFVCFNGASLAGADFRGANLTGSDFLSADVRGVDFRGSNLKLSQLDRVAGINCDTILPNGKSAVPCAAGQTCVEGQCTCQQVSDCPPPDPGCIPACVNGLCTCEF